MKILTALLFLFVCACAHGGLMSPFESEVNGLSIPNSRDISAKDDLKIVRGQRPYIDGKKKFSRGDSWNQISQESQTFLNELFRGSVPAITDVLIFKNRGGQEIASQKEAMQKMALDTGHPINAVQIEFPWKGIKDFVKVCEQTIEALQLMKAVNESTDRSLFLHCTVGEDRTGYLSALWRMIDQDWSQRSAFIYEMCKRGYGRGNPGKPKKVYNAIRASLTPLYIEMSDMVDAGLISYDKLDPKACRAFKGFQPKSVNISKFKCRPVKLP